MNIHEYQAKALLKDYGITVPRGVLADSVPAAEAAAKDLGGEKWAVKAQVHAGGRGQAGGVRVVDSLPGLRDAAAALLGRSLVTAQTGPEGKAVRQLYIEEGCAFEQQIYLAVLIDRSIGRVSFLGAREGGEDIEALAASHPEKIQKLPIDPTTGFDSAAAESFATDLGLTGDLNKQGVALLDALYRIFMEKDASLIEINPLVVDPDGKLRALDVKMNFDDNALYRHPDIEALRDQDEVDPAELEAKRFELNYVKLGGNIGVMVNGAGLALATVDLLKQSDMEPADFMDVRPVAKRDQVAQGFELLIDNPKVKAILVNIYGGGILRCDTIAEGIGQTCRDQDLAVPLIVRFAGTNAELAEQILRSQGIAATFTHSMGEAITSLQQALKREAA